MFAGGRSVTSVTVFLSQSDATVKSLERGRSTCTKMLEQRGLDLEHLFDRGPHIPSDLPPELQDWLIDYLAAKSLQRSLERMSLRLLEQEKEAALKPSPSLKLYPITAYAGSAKVEGELKASGFKQHPHVKGAANTATLIPQAKPSTTAHATESLRWRGKTLVPGQTEHDVRVPTSVGYLGSDDVT